MLNLFTSGLEFVVRSGFLYAPLPFDPAVKRDIAEGPPAGSLVEAGGKTFVKALALRSVVVNYERIDPEGFREIESGYHDDSLPGDGVGDIAIGGKLGTILFEVLPRFVRMRKGVRSRSLGENEIMDLIAERFRIPPGRLVEAERFMEGAEFVRRRLRRLEERAMNAELPEGGTISAREVGDWLRRSVTARIAERENERLRRVLDQLDGPGAFPESQIPLRLHLAGEGSLEIDGFGFLRIGAADEYLVYRHTGEYALKDFYGRLYRFPGCRVAVSTAAPLQPFVIENYKHPFLESHESGQPICMRDFDPPRDFSAAAVVRALEAGANALLRGYSSRRRNGYHSLEPIPVHFAAAEPDDDDLPPEQDDPVIRRRNVRRIDFEEYRVPRDHPAIVTGELEVTNQFTP